MTPERTDTRQRCQPYRSPRPSISHLEPVSPLQPFDLGAVLVIQCVERTRLLGRERRHRDQSGQSTALWSLPPSGSRGSTNPGPCVIRVIPCRRDSNCLFQRAHPDTAPVRNGVATSSSPFQSHSHGDEDIAAPNPFQMGAMSRCAPHRLGNGLGRQIECCRPV
jgi:hypothetical protein